MRYPTAKIKIKAEATGTSGEISAAGGIRTLKIANHLIQDATTAQNIADSYLSDYKTQKTKIIIGRPTPLPYELGDTIRFSDALIPYKPAVSAVISYVAASTGAYYYSGSRDMTIRKININVMSGNYGSSLELESS